MKQCAVFGCTNNTKGDSLFFPFPSKPKLKKAWKCSIRTKTGGRVGNFAQSSVICQKHFLPQDLTDDGHGNTILLPDVVPSLFEVDVKDEKSTVRRSERKTVAKKRTLTPGSKGNEAKKRPRILISKAPVKPVGNKSKKVSKTSSLKKPLERSEEAGSSESQEPEETPNRVNLIGDDERGHAIAEWYLLDIFEGTKLIASTLHTGTLITDCLVANVEETIIDVMSKILQRLSSVIITTLEKEFGIKSNILTILKNMGENIQENVQKMSEKSEEDSTMPPAANDGTYEEVLQKLDPTLIDSQPEIEEEVISLDNHDYNADNVMNEHSYVKDHLDDAPSSSSGKPSVQFQCGFCHYTTTKKTKLRRHVRTHLRKNRHDCPHCDYSSSSLEAMAKHCRTHTGAKPYSCSECSFRTANRSNLSRHAMIHTGQKPFACPYCPHTTRQRVSLNAHMATHTKDLDAPRRRPIYACGDCSFVTTSRAEFKRHVDSHKEYNCAHCDFTTSDYGDIKLHQIIHNGLEHKCCVCHRKCHTADELRVHVATHSSSSSVEYVCDLCDYRSDKASYLRRHLSCHLQEKMYKCDQCPKSFRLPGTLASHMRKHSIGPFCKVRYS